MHLFSGLSQVQWAQLASSGGIMSVQKYMVGRHRRPNTVFVVLALAVQLLTLSACAQRIVQQILPESTPIPVAALNAQIVLSPPSGFAGAAVQVAGTGWQPGETVTIFLMRSNNERIVTTATPDQSGRFAVSFQYPQDEPWLQLGAYTIIATTEDARQQSSASFVVEAPRPPTPTPTITPFMTSTPLPTFTLSPTPTYTPRPVTNTPTATVTPVTPTLTPRTTPWPVTATPTPLRSPQPVVQHNWRGDYWNNTDLSGPATLIRDDPEVNFDWGLGSPETVAEQIPDDFFSVRWTRSADFAPGLYRFAVEVDDGARLYLDDRLILDEWRAGGVRTITTEQRLEGGSYELRLEFFERTGRALIRLNWEQINATAVWQGVYFANPNLQGAPAFVREDSIIDFDWRDQTPDPRLPAESFSVRWERPIEFAAGRYRFALNASGPARVWIDDNLILNAIPGQPARLYSTELYLTGRAYDIRVEYFAIQQEVVIRFDWEQVAATESP
jgi:hypothetical protein